jgi:hypothetical protein
MKDEGLRRILFPIPAPQSQSPIPIPEKYYLSHFNNGLILNTAEMATSPDNV